MSHSTFEHLPSDVLQQIAVSLGCLSFLGPPTDILNFLLVSKTVYLNISTTHIYARLFAGRFDVAAPLRRLGDACGYAGALAKEFVKRFQALRRLRDDAYANLNDPETLRLDLWTAYLMFLENEWKNVEQLVTYARVDIFALNYISRGGRLHYGDNDGGANGNESSRLAPVDSETNALAVSLFWFTDKARVERETTCQRYRVRYALCVLFALSFQYPSTMFPLTTFRISAANPGVLLHPLQIDPSLGWSSGPACTIPDHFGLKLTVTKPLITSPAYLSTAVRSFAMTAQDLRSVEAALVDWGDEETGTNAGSKSYDADWARLRACYEPLSQVAKRGYGVFKPGTLHGKWVGHQWVDPADDNDALVTGGGLRRIELHIREHHQNRKDDVVGYDDISHDGIGSGLLNAWLPRNTRMNVVGNDLLVYDPNTKQSSTYHTYHPDVAAGDDADENMILQSRGLYGRNTHDIILTAQTDETFGQRWGHYRFEGRVRDCDGLVMLVRRSAQSTQQQMFYGYVHGGRSIVGRWRDTVTSVGAMGKTGVWCLTKQEE